MLVWGLAIGLTAAHAQTTPAILADPAIAERNPLPDFSYAGFGFGLNPLPATMDRIIDVTAFGVVPDDGIDDSKALQRALAAARKIDGGVVIQLPKGRIQITEVLRINRGDIIIRGAGAAAGGTELWFPRPLELVDTSPAWNELRDYLVRENKRQVEVENNIDNLFTEWSWSGGFLFVGPEDTRPVSYDGSKDKRDPVLGNGLRGSRFSRTLTVDNSAKLTVGMVVQLQWFAVDGENSAIIRSIYGDTDLPIGSHHWTFPNRPTVAQATRIEAIDGDTITLGDPLLHDVGPGQPAAIAQWRHLENVGIEAMTLRFPEAPAFGHHLEQGYNGIYMTGVFDGWIRDLVVANADSAILTDNAASLTIRDITTTGDRLAHYAVHVGAVHNVLVRGLRIENPVVHPLSVNTRSTRSVFTEAVVLRNSVLDQHSGSNHQNLFDNLTLHIDPKIEKGSWAYRLWEGGGASYWKPGHGLYNTSWNIRLVPPTDFPEGQPIAVTSGIEGPGARIVGIWSRDNALTLSYRPQPYSEMIGEKPKIASLYDYQLKRRRR